MRREQLPITVLPSWSKLNNVSFTGVTVEDLGDSRGFGLVAEKELSSKESDEGPILLTIPHELVLSAEAVRNHAKLDRHFQELLSAAGGKVSASLSSVVKMELKLMFDRRQELISCYFY